MEAESHVFEGRSAAEAAIRACEALGVTRSDLRYEVVSEVGEGLERRVKIRVASMERKPSSAAGVVSQQGVSAPARPTTRTERPERHVDAQRGARGDRPSRGDRGGPRTDRPERGQKRRESASEIQEGRDAVESLLRVEAPKQEELRGRGAISNPSERALAASKVALDLIVLMGFDLEARVVEEAPDEIHIDLVGESSQDVIGPKGDLLLSLQFLVNRLVSRDEERESVIVLDAAGYRERRRRALEDLATRLARRACEEGKAVRMQPMSAHDRRVFHMALRDVGGVATHSEGEGLFRRLLIVPTEV